MDIKNYLHYDCNNIMFFYFFSFYDMTLFIAKIFNDLALFIISFFFTFFTTLVHYTSLLQN
jgi:hypothetical protein